MDQLTFWIGYVGFKIKLVKVGFWTADFFTDWVGHLGRLLGEELEHYILQALYLST